MKKLSYFIALIVLFIWFGAPSNFVPDQASDINTNTSSFDGTLSSADDTVQKALDTLDDAIAGAGTGDVTSSGDCTSGACGDGSSDGGTYYRLYDGDSNYGQFAVANLSANRTYTAPNASGTLFLTSSAITPSANVESILGSADYAAMRTLLDLEAGTDFYSISAADAAFQPLEATLTDIADGTIVEDLVNTANPWADNEVADTITASNYLPLAGGTMTGELKLAAQGLEGTATDTLTDCSTFSATGGGIFYDDSEGQWKKCEDNVLSDLDTGGGGGDSVSIDSVAVTDPDFVSTGDIDFVDTSNTVTANITNDKVTEAKLKAVDAASDEDVLTYETTTGDFEWHSRDEIVGGISAGALQNDSVLEADLKAVDAANDEDIFTYESTTGDFEWHTMDQMIANMSAGGLPNDSILEADLKAVDAANDEECLTYETTTGDFEWQTCGSGSDTNSVKEYWWPASATLPLEAADSIPPISKITGTNVDVLAVSFDSGTDECRTAHFKVPSDVQSGSTITFRVVWFSQSATTNNVIWDARYQSTGAEGESFDQTLTTKSFGADAVQGTVKQITVSTVTETLTNLGWAANDSIEIAFCRDADNASDNMTGDAEAIGFGVEIPRA